MYSLYIVYNLPIYQTYTYYFNTKDEIIAYLLKIEDKKSIDIQVYQEHPDNISYLDITEEIMSMLDSVINNDTCIEDDDYFLDCIEIDQEESTLLSGCNKVDYWDYIGL